MSSAFVGGPRREPVTSSSIQKMLDENTQLIQAILDYQNQGKARECAQYQQLLHRNLIYLATLADSNLTMQAMSQQQQQHGGGPGQHGGGPMFGPHGPAGGGMVNPGLSNNMQGQGGNTLSPSGMQTPGMGMGPGMEGPSAGTPPAPNVTVTGPGELPSGIMMNQPMRPGMPDPRQYPGMDPRQYPGGPGMQQSPGY